MLDKHTKPHTHTPITHKLDRQCKTGHRFGAHYEYQDSQVFNSQAVSVCCQHIKTHTLTHTHTHSHTHIQQQLTHAISLESGPAYFTAALILKHILILDTFTASLRMVVFFFFQYIKHVSH